MLKQRTLKTTIKTTGVGLHTGARVDLVLRPAAPDGGVMFHRTDLAEVVSIPANARHVGDTRLSSTLRLDGASISTVEHVLSALAGLGIGRKMFLHINNSNPALLHDSSERKALERAGWQIPADGMEIVL